VTQPIGVLTVFNDFLKATHVGKDAGFETTQVLQQNVKIYLLVFSILGMHLAAAQKVLWPIIC
jgi:hypothetical protein